VASDGTVLVHDDNTSVWWRLTPNSTGSYIDGTWSEIASLPSGYEPEYFASAILPDGRMIVEGGEYNGSKTPVWTNQGAIYNPITNAWTTVAPPSGWTQIGDAQSDVLDNGTFILANINNGQDALLNPTNLTWTVIPGTGKNDENDEEGWTLEPSGQMLTLDVRDLPNTELFTPSSQSWSTAGDTATGGSPVNKPTAEIGPQVEMPGGNTFVVGAGTEPAPTKTNSNCTTDAKAQTALYHYKAGTVGSWSAGPEIPTFSGLQYDSADGPGSILPDGNVLFDVSKCVYQAPTHFFLYSAGSNAPTQVPDVPNAPNDSTYNTRLLALPNGQVLFDDGSKQMEVYTAGGTPKTAWEPSITSLNTTSLAQGGTYSLSGKQLAGLDQGAAYGDDVQDSTNFPLVRITNSASGVVTYARTFNWSSVSVASGTSSSTEFTLPGGTPIGPSKLQVVANGIASAAVSVEVYGSQQVPNALTAAAPAAATIGATSSNPSPCGATQCYVIASEGQSGTSLDWDTAPATQGQDTYSWSGQKQIPNIGTSAGPALGVLGGDLSGTLVMAWKGESSDSRMFYSSLDGTTWSAQQSVPNAGTSTTPALAGTTLNCPSGGPSGPILFLAWKGEGTDTRLFYGYTTNGSTWTVVGQVPNAATDSAPSLAILNSSEVYLTWKVNGEDTIDQSSLNFCQSGATWTTPTSLRGVGGTSTGPATATDDGTVGVAAWKAEPGDDRIFTNLFTTTDPGTNQRQVPKVLTSASPALASQPSGSNANILMAWKGASTNQIYVGPLLLLAEG
jgi:hypothetical protein